MKYWRRAAHQAALKRLTVVLKLLSWLYPIQGVAMTNYFDTNSANNDTACTNVDLTVSDIATSIVPALIGMVIVGIIAVLMLL